MFDFASLIIKITKITSKIFTKTEQKQNIYDQQQYNTYSSPRNAFEGLVFVLVPPKQHLGGI